MSINMKDPKTALEKIDAASNHVEQIRLALMTGDKERAMMSVEKASQLLFDAQQLMEEEEIE